MSTRPFNLPKTKDLGQSLLGDTNNFLPKTETKSTYNFGNQYTLPTTNTGYNLGADGKPVNGANSNTAASYGGSGANVITPPVDTSSNSKTEPEKKSFGQKSGEWLANNGSVLRGGINFGMNMLMKPAEATLKRTANIINPAIGINQSNKQDMLNSNAKNYNSFVRNNQSTDQVTNMLTSKIGTADKNASDNQIHLKDSDAYQQSYKDFTAAKNSEQKEKDLFDNNLYINQAKAKDLRQDQIKNSINDFGNILHQQAVQNYQNRSDNQAKLDEIEGIEAQDKIAKKNQAGIDTSLRTLNEKLKMSKQKITDLTTRNKQLQQTLTTTPGDKAAKEEYDNNIAQIALEEGNQKVDGLYYQDWNKANQTLKDELAADKQARLIKYKSRIGKGFYQKQGGLFKSGGSLTLEEKKDLASYNAELRDRRDAKRDKVKDLKESLKESKLLAKELYKSSKEDKKEGNKLIMDFYKSIKNK